MRVDYGLQTMIENNPRMRRIFLFVIGMRTRPGNRRESAMPRGLLSLVGFFVSIAVLAVMFVLAVYVFHVSAQLIFLGALPICFTLIMFVPRIIRDRVDWTPNPDRDRTLNNWSMLILVSIVVVCEATVALIKIWEHQVPYLAVIALLSSVFLVRSRVRQMRRR